jgi:hypothetical protein
MLLFSPCGPVCSASNKLVNLTAVIVSQLGKHERATAQYTLEHFFEILPLTLLVLGLFFSTFL